MGSDEQFAFAFVPDSGDARLFIKLSGYRADLVEAQLGLEWALDSKAPESPTAGAFAIFIGYATVAYCRTILHSNVREPLTNYVAIPDGLDDMHQLIKSFRNTTVAHSQSDLTSTYVVADFSDRYPDGAGVIAFTESQTLPWTVVAEFQRLVEHLICGVDELIVPVRGRLTALATEERGAERWRSATDLVVEDLTSKEFTARTRRRAYPTKRTAYWDPVD
ncbi:MAG TPA: hypothetical protein VEW73_09990 [Nocardioides sp.]|nr:hypothetical protein [Nocardioides sp.]